MDDLDEGMRIFFVCADAKNKTNGFIECSIDLLKIPAFKIMGKFGIALKKERMCQFSESLHGLFVH